MRCSLINHQLGVAAFFQDNSALLDLVNSQVLAKPLICLGDGHDGIWNLFREIGEKQERIEILDWYHLIEGGDSVVVMAA